MWSFWVYAFVVCGVASAGNPPPEVNTSLGLIRGSVLNSRLGTPFYAFRGIRYGRAPVGEARFRNPEPAEAWHPQVFDASQDGPMCVQRTQNETDISEDCLRLNVYTKDLNTRKPVIVYIHPGGFYVLSGQSKNFAGPQHLMDRDCVLVTINYRLGTLGFLALGTAEAPGNAGLKDQVLALRWIQQHISKFGGDPQSVTLFGYSAGSFSIGLHMVSPMSRGLFHRAICMSASPVGQWEYKSDGLELADRQARLLKCPTEKDQMFDCLRKTPMLQYANTMSGMFEFNWNPILLWLPVIEEDFGQERFLLEHPVKSLVQGRIHKVPLITGITEYEFISGAYNDLNNATTRQWLNEEFEKYAPIAYLYERISPRSRDVSAELRRFYLNNTELRFPESLEALGELTSDSVIGFEFHRFLSLVQPHVPVYTYFFKYKGRFSHFMYENRTYGAVHHDELLYLLHVPIMTPMFSRTDPENTLIERMTRMWERFAKTGNPNCQHDEYLRSFRWPLYSQEKKEYLVMDNEFHTEAGGIYPKRFALWDELFPVPQF